MVSCWLTKWLCFWVWAGCQLGHLGFPPQWDLILQQANLCLLSWRWQGYKRKSRSIQGLLSLDPKLSHCRIHSFLLPRANKASSHPSIRKQILPVCWSSYKSIFQRVWKREGMQNCCHSGNQYHSASSYNKVYITVSSQGTYPKRYSY